MELITTPISIKIIIIKKLSTKKNRIRVYGYWRARAEGADSAGGSHRLSKPAHLRLDGVCEPAGDVVPPRVSVDGAAGFVVAVLLGPGVEEVADLPRRVAGAATVHLEDEREEARPGRGAERGRGRHMAVEAVALAAGCCVSGGHAHAAVEVARGGADARARVGRAVDDGDVDDGGLVETIYKSTHISLYTRNAVRTNIYFTALL